MKSNFLIVTFSFMVFICDAIASEELTLVVGNCRRPGLVSQSIEGLVEQEKSNFKHLSSFGSNVISVDICPLQEELDYPHINIDFVRSSHEEILLNLKGNHPARIFFEWFPSCNRKVEPCLLPALKNAFALLVRGGELIIDHLPYVLSLPDNHASAVEKLEEMNSETIALSVSSTLKKHKRLYSRSGVVSALLQRNDPFTLHICRGEHLEIRNCLMFHLKNSDSAFDDSRCTFIKGKERMINQIVNELADNLTVNKMDLMALICNGMLYDYRGTHEDKRGHWNLFEQHYYMKTRGSLIIRKLREIGFTVDDNAIQYYKINPYNQRKHAWLIKAVK